MAINESGVDICNRALQKLGANRINSFTDNTRTARACAIIYDPRRRALLRDYEWVFSIKRATISQDDPPPDWGKPYSYTLPGDFLRLIDNYPERQNNALDFQIEGLQIFTRLPSPLHIRYIYDVEDTTLFDALFSEALAANIAMELAEELTQSNSKKQAAASDFSNALNEAKRIAAIEKIPEVPVEDEWITIRR